MLAQQCEGASQFGRWVAEEAWILLGSRQLVYQITGSVRTDRSALTPGERRPNSLGLMRRRQSAGSQR